MKNAGIIFLPIKIQRSTLKTVFLLLLILFCFNSIYPQEKSREYRINGNFLAGMKDDFLEVISSPGRWKGKDLIRFSGFVGGGLLIYFFDEDIHQWFQDLSLIHI